MDCHSYTQQISRRDGGSKMILPPNILNCMSPEDRATLGKAGRIQPEIEEKILAGREKELQKQIASFLNLLEIVPGYSNPTKKTTYTLGWPDFSFPYRDKFVCWECKTIVGRLDQDQVKIKASLEAHPVTQYRIIRSLAEAQNHLREIDKTAIL